MLKTEFRHIKVSREPKNFDLLKVEEKLGWMGSISSGSSLSSSWCQIATKLFFLQYYRSDPGNFPHQNYKKLNMKLEVNAESRTI